MSGPPTAQNDRRYHHGNLRNALIIAAAELIEENGSTDFAMIDAARRAGVSNAAPYRHFSDRDDLLAAVCQLGFMALGERTAAVAAEYPPGSRACIIALGRTYISFLAEHPAFHSLMWGEQSRGALPEESAQDAPVGFYILVEAVRDWCEARNVEATDPLELAIKLWGVAHGLALLAMNGQIDRFMRGVDAHAMFDSATNTFLDGLEQSAH